MRAKELHFTNLSEANVASKIRDEKTQKTLMYAVLNDETIPASKLHLLGKKPTPEQAVKFLSDVIDQVLSNTFYGDISKTNKYDMWLINRYVQGFIDYEDISGEADTLGAFHALGKRNVLDPEHNDINKFDDLQELSRIVNSRYRYELDKMKDEDRLKEMKKNKKDIILINDGEIFVSIPFNYGACYFFNNGFGVNATYCTGSSNGEYWFKNYTPNGIMINVFNIKEPNEDTSKYQLHASSGQIKSASQSPGNSRDAVFAEKYPGLMQKIFAAMRANADTIREMSLDIRAGGYDVEREIQLLEAKFPKSAASKEPGEEEQQGFKVGDKVHINDSDGDETLEDLIGETLEILSIEQGGGYITVQDDWGNRHVVNADMISLLNQN